MTPPPGGRGFETTLFHLRWNWVAALALGVIGVGGVLLFKTASSAWLQLLGLALAGVAGSMLGIAIVALPIARLIAWRREARRGTLFVR
jgi:tellurite resistance protein TehA-like permease